MKINKSKKLLQLVEQASKFKKIGKVGNIEIHVMELRDGNKVVELETRRQVLSIDTREFKINDIIKALQMIK